jgi:hypothetical protein
MDVMIKHKQTIKVISLEILNNIHLIMSLAPENKVIEDIYRSMNDLVKVILEELDK